MGKSSDKIKTRAKCKTIDAYIQRIHGTTVAHIPSIFMPMCVCDQDLFRSIFFRVKNIASHWLLMRLCSISYLFTSPKIKWRKKKESFFFDCRIYFGVKGLQNLILVQTISIAVSSTRCAWTSKSRTFFIVSREMLAIFHGFSAIDCMAENFSWKSKDSEIKSWNTLLPMFVFSLYLQFRLQFKRPYQWILFFFIYTPSYTDILPPFSAHPIES